MRAQEEKANGVEVGQKKKQNWQNQSQKQGHYEKRVEHRDDHHNEAWHDWEKT